MTAHDVRLENDEGAYSLVIEDDFGSHSFRVDPHDVLRAVEGYRQHLLVGESIRVERIKSYCPSWQEYQEAQARTDPEWVDGMLTNADLLRKRIREAS